MTEQQEASSERMTALVEEIVMALVDSPEDVVVMRRSTRGRIVIEVSAADADVGKVIGRQGRTARALRTILDAAGLKSQVRCELDIRNSAEHEGR